MSVIFAVKGARKSIQGLDLYRIAATRVGCGIAQQIRQASSGVDKSARQNKDTTPAGSVFEEVENKRDAQLESKNIDRQSYEYSLSGTDDAVAGQTNIVFDGSKNVTPEEARELSGRASSKHKTLEFSPANSDISNTGIDVEYRAVTKNPPTTVERKASIKEKVQRPEEPQSRGFAGADKRKPDSPSAVAASRNLTQSGSR